MLSAGAPPLVEDGLPQAAALDGLQELLRHDRVRVHVVHFVRDRDAREHTEARPSRGAATAAGCLGMGLETRLSRSVFTVLRPFGRREVAKKLHTLTLRGPLSLQ